ncbi:MarR family winged helix-turn-helix transcriptional regulator [Sutcliffiella halmapala]|uniref:MarR family winged helix-turn-helix transcriptional regulator n=1 Tax=Sutcliffiella halmapala TaxID=79882 RepID=UPI000994918F|nr:MarR family transcriptional regulator [Sutcliffiella halmapala]
MITPENLNQYWTDIYFHLHYTHKEKVTHQVVRILQLVEKRENVGIAEIATYLNVSPNTASEHVKRSIEKGYLYKKRDQKDERKVVLGLTEFGVEILQRNTSLDEAKLEKLFENFDEEEKYLIEKAFKLLSENAKQCM